MNPSCERCGAPRPAASTSPCLRCGSLAADEASGLIDVRKIAATPRPPSQPRLDNLLLAPIVAAAPPPPPPPRRPARASQAPLYAMIGLLTFGVVGLAAASLRDPTPPTSTVLVVTAAPERPTDVADVADEPPAPREPAPATEPLARSPEPTPPPLASVTKEPRKPRPRVDGPAKPDKPTPTSEPTRPEKPATPAPSERPDDVRCLLEPARCKQPEAAPEPAAPAPSAPALPETLSLADMSEGMSAGKAAASAACRSLAKGGEVIRLRISIAGPTGVVLKADPEADGGNPELARCCADALKKASFRPVQKPQIGAATTLKF